MTKFPTLSLIAFLALSSATPTWAVSPRSVLTQSGLNGLSCAQFSRMSPSRRDALVQSANLSAPSTLAPLSTSPAIGRDGKIIRNRSNAVSQRPLQSGTIIAACEAASPGTTLGDAYSHAHTIGAVRL
jgi:hypothetical protein